MNPDVILKNMTEDFGWINQPIKEIADIVSQDPQNMTFAWGVIQNIYNIMLPLGYALIALFFIMEFLKYSTDFHQISMEKTVSLLLKLVIAKLVMDNSFELLMAIFKLTNGVLASMNVSVSMPAFDIETLRSTIEAMDFFERMFYALRMMWFGLIMGICKIIIDVIIYGRFIELFILVAFAPIPLSGIASGELSPSAKRYLQEFSAVCLQGMVMVGVVMIYGGIVQQYFVSDWGVAKMNVSAILLVMMLFKSGSIARRLTGA